MAARINTATYLDDPPTTRPPIGFFGYGWESDDKKWNDIFLLQAGTPKDICKQESDGVFSRKWTNGKAVLDCNKWTA